MDINVRDQAGVTVVEVVGEITAATAAAAQTGVLAAVKPGGRMVLDMGRVDFMSSAGLRVLLMTYRSVTAKGGHVVLAALQDGLKDTLGNVGFLAMLPHQDTLEAALAALPPAGNSP